MPGIHSIALVAHDNCKSTLRAWVMKHRKMFAGRHLYTTGTTGGLLLAEAPELSIVRLQSGPLGGDQQIGAKISEGMVDALVFFWDPLEPMPHDPDIKALLRLATLWNIPVACNTSTADLIVSSPLFDAYQRDIPDFTNYQSRPLPV